MPNLIMAASSSAPALPDMTAATTAVVNVVKSVLSLFEVYPLNIVLTITIACYAFKMFGAGRRAAAGRG